MMRRRSAEFLGAAASVTRRAPLAAWCCLATLVVACYGGVLFGGRQFAFRDSAHFDYPLHWRVQQEWAAGRLPLWEPGSNGGMPMLGSPMSAVLYPGKLVFALVPYAWGIRIYTVGHEVLAFWAMVALMRSWGVSRTGAALAGLSYAFGGPVLSDYFNIIYLVGAAWVPLGFRAADRWLRLGRSWALVDLTLVLAMQVLGGDPESAYLTILCAFGYAAGLARSESGGAGEAMAVGIGARRGREHLDLGRPVARPGGARRRRRPGAGPLIGGVDRRHRDLRGHSTARPPRPARGHVAGLAGGRHVGALARGGAGAAGHRPHRHERPVGGRRSSTPLQFQPGPLPCHRVDLAHRLRDLHDGQSLLDPDPAPVRWRRTPRHCRSTAVRCRSSWPSQRLASRAVLRGGPG